MKDPRMDKLADILINYATSLQPGEKILIEDRGFNRELVVAIVNHAYKAGGLPYVNLMDAQVERAMQRGATQDLWDWHARLDSARMRDCAAYIAIRGGDNAYETADVPDSQKRLYSVQYSQPVHSNIRVPHTKWVVLRYPSPAMAQQAGMSTEQFEDFYFKVCTLDYSRMSRAMDPLVRRMETADRVHIKGPGTDLRFSIKGQRAIKCDGRMNIPDGEIYTAPLLDSVEGVLQYNTPSLYQGKTHENIRFVFKKGQIVEATGSQQEALNNILNTDAGARYIGEFAIGVNPYITEPMKDTLFDEKISGSFHFTPGNCYDEAPNGNKSAVHWDLVCIQRQDYGGGEMWFDDELIRKDGLFVPADLQPLNPGAEKEEA